MRTRRLYYGDLVNRANPLNRGLVSWWLCVPWYMSGPRFVDIAGRNHGTLTGGPVWGDGRYGFGSIVYGSSTGQYANCGSSGAWASTQAAITVEAACLTTTLTDSGAFNGYRDIVAGEDGAGNLQFVLRLRPVAGVFEFQVFDTAYRTASATVTLATNRLYHLVGTFSSAGAAIYVRDSAGGYATGTGAVGGGSLVASPGPLTIGGSNGLTDRQWVGPVYMARYDTRLCSESEALSRYLAFRRGYQNELNWLRRPSRGAAAAVSVSGVSFNAYGGSSGGVPTFISG